MFWCFDVLSCFIFQLNPSVNCVDTGVSFSSWNVMVDSELMMCEPEKICCFSVY